MFLMFLSGCGSSSDSHNNTAWKLTLHETVNNLDGVTMSVKEGAVSSTGLTVILNNNSDKHCIYGKDFCWKRKSKEDGMKCLMS